MSKNRPEANGCISEQQFLFYLDGKLSPAEQHAVERHVLHCELCADALEGLELMRSTASAGDAVAMLKSKINLQLHTQKKHKPISIQWWQVAAIIVIMFVSIGGYLYISQFSENTGKVAQINTEVHDQPIIPPQSDQQIFSTDDNAPIADQKSKSPVVLENESALSKTTITENKFSDDESADKANDVVLTDLDALKSGEAQPAAVNELQKEELNAQQAPTSTGTTSNNEMREATYSTESKLAKTPSARNKKDIQSTIPRESNSPGDAELFNTGFSHYTRKEFAAALPYFEKIAPSVKKYYYTGLTQFELKKFNVAVSSFDMVINEGKGEYYEKALWYKANSLIELKNTDYAKETLRAVISLNGEYKSKAQVLMDAF